MRQILILPALLMALNGPVAAQPLALDFLPPDLGQSDICLPTAQREKVDDLSRDGEDEELTDRDRIRFLRRDIRNLMAEDAERYFEFIDDLITRLAGLDEDFAGPEELLARIALHLDAARLDQMRARGLVPALRGMHDALNNNQRMELAQFYMSGLGVPQDVAYAQELIREAAFGGNARALTEIARMQIKGELLEGWDAPLDLTVTMAFGGILGEMSPALCRRAEQIAQEYLKGEIVERNTATALAWRRFAADMGGAAAAWRVVEFHLNATADRKDNAELRRYLERAVELGLSLDSRQFGQLVSSGAVSAKELEDMLGYNHNQDGARLRNSLIPWLDLVVNIDGLEPDEDGLYLKYLRELAQMASAPGLVFRELGEEVLIRRGRWAAEAEGMRHYREAARRGDEIAMQRLAGMFLRYRDDPAMVLEAENLLLETISRFGLASSMDKLDALFRCQVNEAPLLPQADHWARRYRASGAAPVPISATDLIVLDPFKDPETIAKIQSQALQRRVTQTAQHAQRVQANPLVPDEALQFWAKRLNRSDQALEAFAELEFELATTPMQRNLAVEFFRRVYINNGVTTALDLAIALIEDEARDPAIADEILHLLTMAGNRGEGAAMRLKSRVLAGTLEAADYRLSAQRVYAEFRDTIEARGDFLALMFALPFVEAEKVDDYIDRAVSLMNCGTKDADELGDAYAYRGEVVLAHHWRNVALEFEGGHVLSKLRLSNEQMRYFDKGRAPQPEDVVMRADADGDATARERLFALRANPDLPSYDPQIAAQLLGQALTGAQVPAWALSGLRKAPPLIRETVLSSRAPTEIYGAAARAGDRLAAFEYGMLLRDRAAGETDLAEALSWIIRAAEGGHDEAMVEAGFALGFGLGAPADVPAAMGWLQRARAAGNPRAAAMAALLAAKEAP